MKVLLFRHFAFDDPSAIIQWAEQSGNEVSVREPEFGIHQEWLEALDLLVILGGPMSVYQESEYPWLVEEKAFVKSAIDKGKKVLGICLGAQMIAEVLGASVYPARQKEIGWHRMYRTRQLHPWLAHFPEEFESFSWHGDTFDLPATARLLVSSAACENQAFAVGEHVMGLQFHLETTSECIDGMLANWSHEIWEAPYIQNEILIRSGTAQIAITRMLLWGILDQIVR
ncbi:type 1 glutamine amidotransferase [Paenibacillus ihbetae]|uniref:GMP synthase n=1 Tax=Paenibacillus ihbetae TaxID=1870820 RepID=A0ABX3JZQ5_9BACL|nr:type 1 glutamine amidotransferase [Paenibacillus ihbetae]OOC62664.1 GMP synthase [Paenibacillus ihbetae]